jgi:hypothetical protein
MRRKIAESCRSEWSPFCGIDGNMRAAFIPSVGLAVVFCALAIAPTNAAAQIADETALKAAALSDLSNFFEHAERRDLLPSSVPQVSLYGPILTYARAGQQQILLCSMPVLRVVYYAPASPDAAPSQIAPGRAISNVENETVYRVIEDGTCEAQRPSENWFHLRQTQYWGRDAIMEVAELTLGVISALKDQQRAFADLDLIAFEQTAPAGSVDTLRREHLQRIQQISLTTCASDETSFCKIAEIQFGTYGPLTHLRLTIRSSRPSGQRRWIQSATVWTDFSAIP